MNKEIERIIKLCSCGDTFDYVITPIQRDTMKLVEYIKELQQENQKLKEKVEWYEKENKINQEIIIKDIKVLDEIRELKDRYNLGKYDYSIPVFEIEKILDKVKEL